MQTEKKISKEDTWKPSELRKYLRDGEHGNENSRKRSENERPRRGGETSERRQRDQERESRDPERLREGLRDEGERERRREREGGEEEGRRQPDGETKEHREREREKGRDWMRVRGGADEVDKRRQEREGERRRGERRSQTESGEGGRERRSQTESGEGGRERRSETGSREGGRERRSQTGSREGGRERRSQTGSGEGGRERREKHDVGQKESRMKRDGHQDEQNEKERRERHAERNHQIKEKENNHKRTEEHERRGEEGRERRGDKEVRERRVEEGRERRVEEERERRGDKEERERRGDKEVRERRGDKEERERRGDKKERERRGDKEERERRGDKEERERRGDKEARERRGDKEERERRKDKEAREGRGDKEERERRGDKEERERRGDKEARERRGDKEEREGRGDKEARERRRDKEERERRGDKEEREGRGDKEARERRGDKETRERRGDKEARERRHGESQQKHDEKQKHGGERYASQRGLHGDGEPVEQDRLGEGTSERKAEQAEVASDLIYSHQDYEDDFEEYEEDFEELDESGDEAEGDSGEGKMLPRPVVGGVKREEVEAIRRAMEEENQRAGTAQSRRSQTEEEETRPQESEQTQCKAPQRGRIIDFVAAKQRQLSKNVSSKQKQRSVDLLRLVELDVSPTFSLLDLPPLSEYDVYIKNFGNSNTKQVYVQCHEDDGDQEIQTDHIQLRDKWTQHPAEHQGACRDPQDAQDNTTGHMTIDSQRLVVFLRSAAQVVSVLLEEDNAERQTLRTTRSQADTLSFSDGSLSLNTQLSFLYGRPCSMLLFSPGQRQTMLSVHGPLAKPGAAPLDGWTLVCIWNIWEPSRPQKILVYEAEVLTCCFSPGKSALVFAGTSVGSVLLWDLREPPGSHHTMTISDVEWTFRQPTFSTDAVLSTSGHLSSVRSVKVLPSSAVEGLPPELPLLASEGTSGMSFQLASLDESGVLNIWVVLELPTSSHAGSQTDLGLRPGGRVKLLHSSCLASERTGSAALRPLQLHFLPTDSTHFFIGTNMGLVLHGTSHGFKAPPKVYRSQEVGERPVDVTSLDFSPFSPDLFLVGCADGSVRLHAVSSAWSLAEWSGPVGGVVSVRWSLSRPAVFCVLDTDANLHVWDLNHDGLRPVVTETFHADRATAMAVFGDATQNHTYAGVALAHQSGKLQVHYFNRRFTVADPAEESVYSWSRAAV